MVTIFTLCSANYLAQAMALGDSVKEQNPEYEFVIGLVDRMPKSSKLDCPFEIIPVENIGIPNFWDMVKSYDIVELNTAVKPFYLEFLYARNVSVKTVIYIDPDILVCSSLAPMVENLARNNLLLTPHHCTYDDSPTNVRYELAMLNFGIYNLGYIGTSRTDVTAKFLKWWQKRLQHHCYYQPGLGFFVDQLWMTLAPFYFPGVFIEKNPGYNMAYWNLFERRLSRRDGVWFVNDEHRLVFYHFSGYDPMKPNGIIKRQQEFVPTFEDRPDLRPLFDDYARRVLARNFTEFKTLKYSLRQNIPATKRTVKKAVKKNVQNAMKSLPLQVQDSLQRLAQFTINSFK